jgi:hypothetical protein
LSNTSQAKGKKRIGQIYQVLSHGQDGLNPIGVGPELGLEGLVLLVLRLDIGRIFVRFFLGELKLLEHPVFDFVGVARKLLQRLRLSQSGAFLNLKIVDS